MSEPFAGGIHGFGRLWRKVHRIGFNDLAIEPAEVIRTWREEFAAFWPAGNYFQGPDTRLQEGEVAVLDLDMPGGARLETGVLVLYADDDAFTLTTPHGHMFAGWISFSAFHEAGTTIAQVEIVMRATDPVFEIGLELVGHGREHAFWEQTLSNLARHFGVESRAETRAECLDRRRQWRYARNVWHNAGIRSVLHVGLAPIGRMARRARRGQPTSGSMGT